MSDRRVWPSLAAEAQAIDKATHWQSLRREKDLRIRNITVLTDNLSLNRVVQSGRPTQEQSLRSDIAVISDLLTHNDN